MTIRKIHNIVVGIYALYRIFLIEFIPEGGKELSNIIAAIFGLILIAGNLYYFFFDRETARIKLLDEIVSNENGGNYFQIWLLLSITNLDPLNLIGAIFYLSVSISLLIFSVWILVKDFLKTRSVITGIIVGHLIFGYFMYSLSKSTFTRNYGNEIIGSFWEKPDYTTKYLVKLYKGDSDQFYTLPAKLHVYSEGFEEDYGDGYQSWTEHYIQVETVYFNNGGSLTFDECDLNEAGKVLCIDQNGETWQIELTNEKIE